MQIYSITHLSTPRSLSSRSSLAKCLDTVWRAYVSIITPTRSGFISDDFQCEHCSCILHSESLLSRSGVVSHLLCSAFYPAYISVVSLLQSLHFGDALNMKRRKYFWIVVRNFVILIRIPHLNVHYDVVWCHLFLGMVSPYADCDDIQRLLTLF